MHCELPHRGYRPFIWDLLLRGYVDRGTAAEAAEAAAGEGSTTSGLIGAPIREIRDDERELIRLDATRTRFGETLAAGLKGGRELLPAAGGGGSSAGGDDEGKASSEKLVLDQSAAALEHILRGWLERLPQDAEYRQGADSLAAVVLSVVLWGRAAWINETDPVDAETGERKSNSADLTTATASTVAAPSIQHALDSAVHLMGRVVADFVPGYFLRGDTTFLQTQLRRVRLCLWFWDPDLAVRLFDELEIPPAMFAVPWFITLFADVWPIDRVAYVWDALFSVGPPLLTFLAVAVLRAKREDLMRVGVGIDPATGRSIVVRRLAPGRFDMHADFF